MKVHWVMKGVIVAVCATLAAGLFGLIVMALWNALLPDLFGWPRLGFWQGLGLLVLSRILFGGWRGGAASRIHWRRRMRERWERMTPEEREKLRQGMRGYCGDPGVPAPEAPKP